jgi:hypothetical protein
LSPEDFSSASTAALHNKRIIKPRMLMATPEGGTDNFKRGESSRIPGTKPFANRKPVGSLS